MTNLFYRAGPSLGSDLFLDKASHKNKHLCNTKSSAMTRFAADLLVKKQIYQNRRNWTIIFFTNTNKEYFERSSSISVLII